MTPTLIKSADGIALDDFLQSPPQTADSVAPGRIEAEPSSEPLPSVDQDSSIEWHINPIDKPATGRDYWHVVGGEVFVIEFDKDTVYLRHRDWSLIGSGPTLGQAEVDLLREARELALSMANLPISSLSPTAYKLRQFVFDVL